MKKKLTAILLAAAMVASLAACGSAPAAPAPAAEAPAAEAEAPAEEAAPAEEKTATASANLTMGTGGESGTYYAFGGVLAQFTVDIQQFNVVTLLEAVENAQSGGAFAAVDEDFRFLGLRFFHVVQVLSV